MDGTPKAGLEFHALLATRFASAVDLVFGRCIPMAIRGLLSAMTMDSPSIEPRFMRSPRDFELAAADWLRCWGFLDARATGSGRDGGVDVECSQAIAQVKSWMTPVGSPEIQQLRGAAHDGRAAFFFSLMHYTAAATEFADRAGVRLFRFSGYSGEVEPSTVTRLSS